jgi:predicted ATPase/DNA-binding CsgD family transcriptional regulator
MEPIDSDITTLSGLRTALPIVPTRFVGRQREMAEAQRLLLSSRVVTLTGAAGGGKTRLALRLAEEVHRHYADGAHWVELARLGESERVPEAVARALHVAEQPGRTTVEGVLEALRDKRLLLVLDNCEHVLSACADLMETLLTATEVCVLATSREPLCVAGEMRYTLSPMTLPPLSAAMEDLDQFDAIQLFVERARAILPGFTLTHDNAAVVSRICHRLDGLPLAIELVSARVNVLTLEEIFGRLDDRLDLLPTASHPTHGHHQSLRVALDWSYDLLPASEQRLLRRLSVFAGGWSLATAEAVCAEDGIERERVLEVLSALINKSLVVAHTLQRAEARYTLLETIRQYAHDKLIATNEWVELHERHLRYFLQLAEETEPKLSGHYQQLWLNWLEGEHANIGSALTWSQERRQIEEGLRIVNALYQFWIIRDHAQEGLEWLTRLLAQADEEVAPVVHAQALAYAAILAGFRGRILEQMRYGREAAALAAAAGDEGKPALVWALSALAHGARAAAEYETEFDLAQRVIQLRRDLGDAYFLGLSLTLYSPTAMILGKYKEAHAMLDEGLTYLRQAGNTYRIAMALNYCGDLARCERQYAQACSAYEESASSLREIGATRDLASVLHNWGHACLHLADVERAQLLFRESMALQQAQGNTPGLTECLIGFAALVIVLGSPGAGALLLAAAEMIGGPRIASAWAATRMEYEHYLARARASLSETEFQAEQTAGRALSLEQAVQYAQQLPLTAAASPLTRKKPDNLTVREREVAALVAQGKSNGEIADELVVSKRTVETHIAHILAKRGFTNRAQMVRWAIEVGLTQPAR